jgi:hypothetical protein
MNPKSHDPYKFENPLEGNKHSVAGRRHEKHSRHPHTILGAIAPDAAPGVSQNQQVPTARPIPLPPKPVDEILPTALPAKESYDEAAIVAKSAFHPQYVVPQSTINPVLYGTGGIADPNDPNPAPAVVPPANYDMSGKSGSKAPYVIIAVLCLFVIILIAVVLVLVASHK